MTHTQRRVRSPQLVTDKSFTPGNLSHSASGVGVGIDGSISPVFVRSRLHSVRGVCHRAHRFRSGWGTVARTYDRESRRQPRALARGCIRHTASLVGVN